MFIYCRDNVKPTFLFLLTSMEAASLTRKNVSPSALENIAMQLNFHNSCMLWNSYSSRNFRRLNDEALSYYYRQY